ncbi:hypothetical protein cyc_04049 [Cyclospora cayetanensis]|uniref:Uncharacterized protein n=1 Tax=Cyclospora cayetanensis TaxID=88456 RepID=A0A1D3D608_9EIME|nr:hypothetical protein cyc_04049 [Cyclospora cayetanensis]
MREFPHKRGVMRHMPLENARTAPGRSTAHDHGSNLCLYEPLVVHREARDAGNGSEAHTIDRSTQYLRRRPQRLCRCWQSSPTHGRGRSSPPARTSSNSAKDIGEKSKGQGRRTDSSTTTESNSSSGHGEGAKGGRAPSAPVPQASDHREDVNGREEHYPRECVIHDESAAAPNCGGWGATTNRSPRDTPYTPKRHQHP